MEQEFKINRSARTIVALAKIALWVMLPSIAYILIDNIAAIARGSVLPGTGVAAILASAVGLYFVISFPLLVINQYCDIRVIRNGLFVKLYIFKTVRKFIKWEDVLYIKKSSILDRWGNPQWIVRVRSLYYWNKLIGWQNGVGLVPCIIINSDMTDQRDLVRVIEKHCGKYH